MVAQRVTVDFLDKNKDLAWRFKDICFAAFPGNDIEAPRAYWGYEKKKAAQCALPDNVRYLRFKPEKINVEDQEAKEFLYFLKGVDKDWHRMLKGVGLATMKDRGMLIDVNEFDTFKVYTLMVALRSLYELPQVVSNWCNYVKVLPPVEAFIAAHCMCPSMDWNSNHALLSISMQQIAGTEWKHFEENFPKAYEGVPMSKWAGIYCDPKGNDWGPHQVFRREPLEDIRILDVLKNWDEEMFVAVHPLKGKELYEFANTNLIRRNPQLPIFDNL